MFPEDMQGLIAKIIFFIFATCALCLSRIRADEGTLGLKNRSFFSPVTTFSSIQKQK